MERNWPMQFQEHVLLVSHNIGAWCIVYGASFDDDSMRKCKKTFGSNVHWLYNDLITICRGTCPSSSRSNGAWCMVLVALCVVQGAWCMVCAWRMVHGARCLFHQDLMKKCKRTFTGISQWLYNEDSINSCKVIDPSRSRSICYRFPLNWATIRWVW